MDCDRATKLEPAAPRANAIPLWPGVVVSLLCGAIYLLIGSGGTLHFLPSTYIHHTLTANAWLHGRLYATSDEIVGQAVRNQGRRAGDPDLTDGSPPELLARYRARLIEVLRENDYPPGQIDSVLNQAVSTFLHDWVQVDDRYYAYWPPLPALLMLPLVWLWGPGVSDVLAANLLGVASVAFVYLMLRALRPRWPQLTTPTCAALTLGYGLGTCHLYQASLGQVWYLTQLSATLGLIIAIWCGLNALQRPGWLLPAGIALGLGFLGRNTIILAAPFFALVAWIGMRGAHRVRDYARWAAVFFIALLAAVAVQLWFNQARFGDAFDSGQGRQVGTGGNVRFVDEFKEYGRFSLHYVPRNLWHYFLDPYMGPLGGRPAVADGESSFDPDGNSLFLVSPFMLYLFRSWRRGDALLAAVIAGALPGTVALMLFHNTGWYQFGQRYLLDTMPFLLILSAFGMRGRLTLPAALAILAGIAVNAWGTYRFHLEQP